MDTSVPSPEPTTGRPRREVGDERRRRAYPLHRLPEQLQQRIADQVAQPRPPSRWLALGAPDSPRPMAYIESRGWYEWHWQRGIEPDRREPISPALRRLVIDRDGYVCGICGGVVESNDVHLDHIKPHSLGGPTIASNLRVTHSRCNIKKGARY
jgi:5-methylcytosine-specific restriction endonuclease McrA